MARRVEHPLLGKLRADCDYLLRVLDRRPLAAAFEFVVSLDELAALYAPVATACVAAPEIQKSRSPV
jgi:hypothetical protein